MLNIINEELMAYSTISTTEKGKSYTKIKVATSNKIQQFENDSRFNKNREDSQETPKKVRTGASIISNNDVLKPLNREIIRISAPLKNIGDFVSQEENSKTLDFDLPMSINVDASNKYQPRVEVRCHEQGDDRANLYVIAFPFNGMIKPIPENPQYRIYRGLIASSAKPFFFNNRKYRKVLYLVVEINKNLFKPDHKYHTDRIDIQLESYALFNDRETNERKTNCESFTLSIISADGEYVTDWKYETVDDAIMMSVEPGQQLWVTYDVTANRKNNHRNNDDYKKNNTFNNNKHKSITIEGDMMVTTNKHGIRKEIPMNTHNNNRNRNQRYQNRDRVQNQSSSKNSIDRMMQDSGMFDNDHEYNRGKKNGGKRPNNRDRNRGRF